MQKLLVHNNWDQSYRRIGQALATITILVAMIAAITSDVSTYSTSQENFTELYITSGEGILPFSTIGRSKLEITAGIVNHTSEQRTYALQVTSNGQVLYESNAIHIGADEEYDEQLAIDLTQVNPEYPIYINLMEEGRERPLRSLRLSSLTS